MSRRPGLHFRRVALAALAAAALGACHHMQVPPELKADVLPIEEKPGLFRGNLRFGPFQARDIDQGFTRGGTTSFTVLFATYASTDQSQDFSFRFLEQGQPERYVACRAALKGSSSSIRLGGLRSDTGNEERQTLDCKFGPPGAAAPEGILRLADEGPGRLDLNETVLEVFPNHQFDNGAEVTATLGYVLARNGQPVAAVDVNLVGAWLKRDLPPAERTTAGLGAAILLLYRPQEPK